ncbi:MAG: PDGLE domain-containing protein [Desulfurococcales archaeon]|nr:PDGLE domain-containing protein [Desulfurococcales archaeon]
MPGRKAWMVIILLVIVSPIFGVILADRIGYHEPLDVAAEKLGLSEKDVGYHTPFEDYTFPGLGPVPGYIAAGLLGVIVILVIGKLLELAVSKK